MLSLSLSLSHIYSRLAELFYEEYINRNETGLEDATQLIVDTVASIPGFVKTVLLIDKETERMQVMQKRFMKRVLLSHRALCRADTVDSEREEQDAQDENERLRSAGAQPNDFGGVVLESWLLALLDSHETIHKIRAVDYMEFVSNLTLKDYLQATVSKKENKPGGESEAELREKFHETRCELFDKVATLPHLLVLLITLPVEQVERASVVGMVQWALYKALKKPFVTFMNFCDFFFHLSLLGIWRLFLLLDVRFAQGADESTLLGSWLFGFVVAIACIMYFSYRWVGDIISLARIKVQLAVKFVLSLQTLVQLTLVVLVIVSTAGSGITSTALSATISSATYSNVTAVSLGFLWLKVVLFLQIVNQKMAAYIIALVQVRKKKSRDTPKKSGSTRENSTATLLLVADSYQRYLFLCNHHVCDCHWVRGHAVHSVRYRPRVLHALDGNLRLHRRWQRYVHCVG